MQLQTIAEFEKVLRMATRRAICTEVIPHVKLDGLRLGLGPRVIEGHIEKAWSPYMIWTLNSNWRLTVAGCVVAENDTSEEAIHAVSQAVIGKPVQSWKLIDYARDIDIRISDEALLSIRALRSLDMDEYSFWTVEAGRYAAWESRSDGRLSLREGRKRELPEADATATSTMGIYGASG